MLRACRDHDVRYSITVNQNKAVVRAIEAVDEESWTDIDYTIGGQAQVAECSYGDGHRLVIRRTRLVGKQAQLFPLWRQTLRPRTYQEAATHLGEPWTAVTVRKIVQVLLVSRPGEHLHPDGLADHEALVPGPL